MNLSLRSQLVILLVSTVVALTAVLGWLAYGAARGIVEQEAMRMVGFESEDRRAALLRLFLRNESRMKNFLGAAKRCGGNEACLRSRLEEFQQVEGALAVRLQANGRTVVVGEHPLLSVKVQPREKQIVQFAEESPARSYITWVRQEGSQLDAVYDTFWVNNVFQTPDGSGDHESFVMDTGGRFITAPAHQPTARYDHARKAPPMTRCLAGQDGTMVATDYRGATVIHGFRWVPEIGGGCVMANRDAEQAFSPAGSLGRWIGLAFGIFALLAVATSVAFASLLTRPVEQLTSRARALQTGDFESPVPSAGPREFRQFAQTFGEMALSLKRSSESLQEREERLQAIVQSSPLGIIAVDLDGAVTLWNPEAERMFGYTADEVLGKKLPVLPSDRAGELEEVKTRVLRGDKAVSIETVRQRKDGSKVDTMVSAAPLHDAAGNVTGVLAMVRDISERKQAEREREKLVAAERKAWDKAETEMRQRAESESKFRAVADTAASAIYIHDGDKLLYVNRAAEEITGYPAEELLGMEMWRIVHPDDRGLVQERSAKRLGGVTVPTRYEYRIIRKDGRIRWLDFSASEVMFGGKRAVLGTAFDVTERKQTEIALRNSEKLAATGRMAATIAHEINNPLASVMNLIYLLGMNPTLDDQGRRYADMAQQELGRVVHIVRQTLGFYRESSTPVMVDLSDLVENVLQLYERKIRSNRTAIVRDYKAAGVVEGFPGEMRQVFSNLIVNAIEAMQNGGTLTLRVSTGRDWRTGVRSAKVLISDTGPGISPQNLQHIFEPFFTTKGERGTGLGLWVTHGIVQKHHGRILVRSRAKGGTTGTCFLVILPVRQQHKEGEEQRAPEHELHGA